MRTINSGGDLQWPITSLRHVTDGIRDGTHGSFERVDDGVPFLSAKNIQDGLVRITANESYISEESYLDINRTGYLRPQDVLLTIVGSIGRAAIFESGYIAFQRSVASLRPSTDMNSRYLYYWVCSSAFQGPLAAATKQTAQGGVYLGDLAGLPVAKPPPEVQSRIADFLDRETGRIDALVEKKRRLIELLEEKRTALISHVVTKGLDPTVPMKDSGIPWLGEIPAHWRAMPLRFVARQTRDAIKTGPFGTQLLASDMTGQDVKVFNQRGVIDRDLRAGDEYVSEEKYAQLKSFTAYAGDLLITARGTIGRCVVVPEDAGIGILHPCLIRIQADSATLQAELLEILVQDSALVLPQLKYLSNATTIDVIYSGNLKEVRVPVPPIQEQAAVVERVRDVASSFDGLQKSLASQLDLLAEYRQALITAAVTGQIDVDSEALKPAEALT